MHSHGNRKQAYVNLNHIKDKAHPCDLLEEQIFKIQMFPTLNSVS